jgi:hypothetical protein
MEEPRKRLHFCAPQEKYTHRRLSIYHKALPIVQKRLQVLEPRNPRHPSLLSRENGTFASLGQDWKNSREAEAAR